MKTNSIAALVSAYAIALFVTSCDSKQEQVREEKLEQKAESIDATADQLRKDGERVAEMKEESADAIREKSERAADATEDSADATRKNVEQRADQLEEAADDVREKK
jgi:gas vesicle protein